MKSGLVYVLKALWLGGGQMLAQILDEYMYSPHRIHACTVFAGPEAPTLHQPGAKHAKGCLGRGTWMEEATAWIHSACLIRIYVCQPRGAGMCRGRRCM